MPRLPRRPGARRPRGAMGGVAATLARRKAAREPRVVVRDRGGRARVLDPSDPVAGTLLDAAGRLIFAAQRRSDE
jgi:hypothetical protein